jgi:hypothetical protein
MRRVFVLTAIALCLSMSMGCKPKPTCSSFAMDHASVPSKLPTSFERDLATAKFSSCSDGRTYSVQCRHGSVHTECECAVDGVVRVKVKSSDRLTEERPAASAYANEKCDWALR